MITVKIMEGNGKEWTDDQWLEEPNQEDCIREYNPGCLVVVTIDGVEVDIYET